MQIYEDPNGDSGIEGYVVGDESITVYFKGGKRYIYWARNVGVERLYEMIELAASGDGVNAYINANLIVKSSGTLLA